MSAVLVCSVGGAPGVTTVACLLGALAPLEAATVVAECDPAGGALAARFGLDGARGMTSLVLAAREDGFDAGRGPLLGDHLQRLPGGLEVLVGPPGSDAARLVDAELAALPGALGGSGAIVADGGRLLASAPGQQALLAAASVVVVVVPDDPAAVATLASASGRLCRHCDGRVGLAVVTGRSSTATDVADVVGVPVAAVLPIDRAAAAIVRGRPGRPRRLARSPLVAAVGRLQQWVADQ